MTDLRPASKLLLAYNKAPSLDSRQQLQPRKTMSSQERLIFNASKVALRPAATGHKNTKMLLVDEEETRETRRRRRDLRVCETLQTRRVVCSGMRTISDKKNWHKLRETISTARSPSLGNISAGYLLKAGKLFNYQTLLLPLLATTLLLGLLSSPLLLEVEAIKLQPEGKEKFYWSGEQFVITCQNNNNIKNVKFRWVGPNNADITEHRDVRVHTESAGPHGHRLVVLNATAGVDDGLYRCELGSTDMRTPREIIEFNLKLFQTTSFKDTAKHLVLPVGSRGQLNCHVEFDPNVMQPTVSWHRDQKPIEMFNDSSYTVLEYDQGRQLSQLTIRPLTRKQDGVYSCRADAITSHLSKISEHEIKLETNYAPIFDTSSPQTIWVERFGSNLTTTSGSGKQSNFYASGRPSAGTGSSYQKQNRFRGHSGGGGGRGRNQEVQEQDQLSEAGQLSNNNNSTQIIRVELKCSCQSNPPASIIWTASDNRPFLLARGEPAHVLEDPRTQTEGHNTTSILVIGYNLDPNWSHRQTSYICSASNQLGEVSMTFKIEQGDPPPAFAVGPHKSYNPESSMFVFTLFGANFDPDSNQNQPLQQQQPISLAKLPIQPPVDSFRIRAESSSGSNLETSGSSQSSPSSRQPGSEWQRIRSSNRLGFHHQPDPSSSVQVSLAGVGSDQLELPQLVNISLRKLPSGNQRLFLEAHNAVGWSPNATYLGDYYIVSGSVSQTLRGFPLTAYLLMLISILLVSYGSFKSTACYQQQRNKLRA